ncbi:MAG: hypothetical protein IPN67_18130 [Bacteroidales bacterium]|nr:hypothetical protein [Bacteroidales bacterium]
MEAIFPERLSAIRFNLSAGTRESDIALPFSHIGPTLYLLFIFITQLIKYKWFDGTLEFSMLVTCTSTPSLSSAFL